MSEGTASEPLKGKVRADAVAPEGPESLTDANGAGFDVRHHADHPGHRRHRLGHPVDEQVKIMAHLFEPYENLRANGSGLVAFVAWMEYLEGRAEQGAAAAGQRLRGLTHR
jgi:hypothetical protein